MLERFYRWVQTSFHVKRYALYFIRWCVLGYALGVLGGLIGGAFGLAVAKMTQLRMANDWMLFLMPLAGLFIIWLYQITGEEKNRGTNMVLEAVSTEDVEVTKATGPLILISTVISHAVGASVGREGAALQIGGWLGRMVGNTLGKIPFLALDDKEKKIAVMAGMAAVFGALFGTPVAAGIFCMEVFSVGIMYYAAMLPCFLAAFLGKDVAMALGLAPEAFHLETIPTLDSLTVQPIVLLGILLAFLSVVFIKVLHGSEHYFKHWFPNPYVRALAVSAIFIGLTLILNDRTYNGSSMILIEQSIEGHVRWEGFLLKMIFTAIALSGGFKGGEIVPTLCVGACFGCAVGTLIGFEPGVMAACGMIGLFAAVTNCPIASIMIGMELFGGDGLGYFAVVVSLAYSLSGYYSLYGSQKFIYAKIKNEYLNRKAR